ncbi:hypothetical protein QTO34_015930 [Cnephaeus nilssonii]|uniref:Uncharacterized protein n=1 Tax=Cnephaeus nilssonii TaxID=3371016 RepID=A0AA40LRM1_CNENI|nr:hypothetical protein QTO34_015930 [Eptesicus nilssonii]
MIQGPPLAPALASLAQPARRPCPPPLLLVGACMSLGSVLEISNQDFFQEAKSLIAQHYEKINEDCCGYSESFFIPDEFLESSFKLFRFPILAITRKLKLPFAWTWAVCCGDFAPPEFH